MSTQKTEIKDIIRKIRTESGKSREKLSIECNIAAETIKNLENGKTVEWPTVMAIASALNMNLGDLNPCIGKEAPKKEDEKKKS